MEQKIKFKCKNIFIDILCMANSTGEALKVNKVIKIY